MAEEESRRTSLRLASLLFDAQLRPDAAVLANHGEASHAYGVIAPTKRDQDWVELLRDGLTFDVTALPPAPSAEMPDISHRFGLPGELALATMEAVNFAPGPHLSGGEHLLPVVRVAAGLLSSLCQLPGARAVAWHPSRSAISPAWFTQAVDAWIAGGPFPALALSALARGDDGAVTSEGLAFLVGQEFRLPPRDGLQSDLARRIAVRLTDWLVAHGRVDSPREVVLTGAGAVWLEPVSPSLIDVTLA